MSISLLLFSFFCLITSINTLFYFSFYWLAFSKKTEQQPPFPNLPVSLIICSKNESANLKKNVPKWLAQAYDHFEMILVNDSSTDDTADVVDAFASEHSNITAVHVKNVEAFWGSKKYAMTLGIKRAQYQNLVFTDADCIPSSCHWLSHMVTGFTKGKHIILGYGAYEKVSGSFLNKLIRYETLLTAMQYFSKAMSGRPYMGVGRNLAYTSEVFYENRGFVNHIQIPSGDDDLFVNGAATAYNTEVCIHPEAFTISEPKQTVKAWRLQKRRHIGVVSNYKRRDQWRLGLFYCSQLLWLPLAILSILVTPFWVATVLIIMLRYFTTSLAVAGSAKRLQEMDVFYWFPCLELSLVYFQISIFIQNLFEKPSRWK